MYDYIYQFILDNLFNSNGLAVYEVSIMGITTNMNVWLSHTLSIIAIILIYIIAVLLIKGMFKLVVNLFRVR